jgi:hypothetical protein
MNPQLSCSQPAETSSAVPMNSQGENLKQNHPRIERCEFEALLQRAMEILNARDLKVQLESKRS